MKARLWRMSSFTFVLITILASVPGVRVHGSELSERAGGALCDYPLPHPRPARPPVEPNPGNTPGSGTLATETEGRIAYIGPDDNVWLVSPDGRNRQRLTSDANGDSVWYRNPEWSPDGSRLAFCKLADRRSLQGTLMVTRAVNPEPRRVADSCLAAWSPESQSIAVAEESAEGSVEACGSQMYFRATWTVYTISLDTGARTEVARTTVDSPRGRGVSQYHWDVYLSAEQGNLRSRRHDLNWSADSRWMTLETPDCVLLIDASTAEVENLDARAAPVCGSSETTPRQFVFSPQESEIAYVEPHSRAVIVSADVLGKPDHRYDRSVSERWPFIMGWSRDGAYLFHQWGGFEGDVVRTDADLTRPVIIWEGDHGVALGRLTSSPDSQLIAFSVVTGEPEACLSIQPNCHDPETHIWVSHIDGSSAVRLVEGRQPAWQPSVSTISLDPFLERKQATVHRLEQATVEIMSVPFPIAAFDDRAAEDLIRRLELESGRGELRRTQADTFARVTLQEEVIAELLPLYASTAGDLAHIGADAFGAVFSIDGAAGDALEACTRSGNPFSGACNSMRRAIRRRSFSLLDSVIEFTIRHADQPGGQDFLLFWDVLSDGIGVQIDTGKTVKEMLLDTAVKGAATRFLVQQYANHIQASLDQGIRSADPSYSGEQPTWTTDGSLARAEVHARSLPRQATNISEYAHSVHDDVVDTARLADVLADLGDLGALSPFARLARIAKITVQVQHFLIDLYSVKVDLDSLSCTRHLSEEAGPLVFSPEKPAPSCSDRIPGGRLSSGKSSQATLRLQFQVPEETWSHMRNRRAGYEEALRDVLAALPSDDSQEITKTLAKLERKDADMFTSMAQALSLSCHPEDSSHHAVEAYEQVNRGSVDALRLYLLVGEYLMAPDDDRSTDEIEGAAQDVLRDLQVIEEALAEASAPEQPVAMPVIERIVVPAGLPSGDSFDVAVSVRNVGTEDARRVGVRLIDENGQPAEVRIERLRAGEVQTTTLTAKVNSDREAAVVVEVNVDGSITDAGVRRLSAGDMSSNLDASPRSTGRSFPCVCGAFAFPILTAVVCLGARRFRSG